MSNNIVTYQVLLDIAKMLKELQSNPKALEEASIKSYSLGAVGEKRVADAKQTLADNNLLLANIKSEQEDLKTASDAIDKKKEDLEATRVSNEKDYQFLTAKLTADVTAHKANVAKFEQDNIVLNNYKLSLDEQLAQHKQEVKDFLAEREKFSGEVAAHESAKKILVDKQLEIDLYEKNLKARAAKLREQTEGL